MALDIFITEITLPDFLERTTKTQAADIRALTVNIDYDRLLPPERTCQNRYTASIPNSLTAQALWTHLRNLARTLQHMTALTTFAFTIVRPKCNFWIPRDILIDLVHNLPLQCRNLEIDTNALDRVREEDGLNEHLCEALSHALPNLLHLRLRLKAVCLTLFQAVSAPRLETISVNCIGSDPLHCINGKPLDCGVQIRRPLATEHNDLDAAPYIAQSLRDLAAAHCPNLKLATVTDITNSDLDDRSSHHCFSIRDALANKTHALPFVRVMWVNDSSMLLRAREEAEYMSTRATMHLLAEGQVWKETIDGLRLPASLFLGENSPYTAKSLHFLTVAEWGEQNPKKTCPLWANEKKTGCRLVDATVLEGVAEHAPLKEDTPEGFVRYEEKSDLWRVEEEADRGGYRDHRLFD